MILKFAWLKSKLYICKCHCRIPYRYHNYFAFYNFIFSNNVSYVLNFNPNNVFQIISRPNTSCTSATFALSCGQIMQEWKQPTQLNYTFVVDSADQHDWHPSVLSSSSFLQHTLVVWRFISHLIFKTFQHFNFIILILS